MHQPIKYIPLLLCLVFVTFALSMGVSRAMDESDFYQDIDEDTRNDITPKRLSLNDIQKNLPDVAYNAQHPFKKLSTIEELYSSRIVDTLEQYGYDLFTASIDAQDTKPAIPAGVVQDDYILSAGDELTVVIRGQINSRTAYKVNNQGLLIIDDIAPINVVGRRLKDVKQELQEEVSALHNTQIHVTLSNVRQIGVLVVGHINKPGR